MHLYGSAYEFIRLPLSVVGNQWVGTKRRRARLSHVPCENMEKVSDLDYLSMRRRQTYTNPDYRIIHENITSALIMESDVDWDMRIKQSMVGIGEGVKAIADWPFPDSSHPRDFNLQPHPYGDKWDLMWIGHCGSSADGNGRIYSYNDTSAPDEEHAWSFAERPSEGHRPPGTRIVFQMKKTVCTTAYAISNQGARKFEAMFKEANSPIDLKMWGHCEHDPTFSCLGVWPQVISMAESKTNIKHTGGGLSFGHEVTEEKVVAGKGIQISARVNAHAGLADKGPTEWKAEWRDGEKVKEEGQDYNVDNE